MTLRRFKKSIAKDVRREFVEIVTHPALIYIRLKERLEQDRALALARAIMLPLGMAAFHPIGEERKTHFCAALRRVGAARTLIQRTDVTTRWYAAWSASNEQRNARAGEQTSDRTAAAP